MDESDKATEAFRRKMGRFLENPEKPIILPEIAQPKAPKIPDHNRQVGGMRYMSGGRRSADDVIQDPSPVPALATFTFIAI